MANKKGNMFGNFANAAEQREQEQAKIEATVTGTTEKDTGRMKKRGADATTITLSISREDKALVKSLAARKGLAVSDLLHQWIEQACAE